MLKKNQWSVKMVNPAHIAAKKYWGCSTPKSVQTFCNRYNVNCFWWRPPSGGRKVLMVDFKDFRDSYKEIYGTVRTMKKTSANAKTWNKTKASVSTRKKTNSSYSKVKRSSTRRSTSYRSH